MHTAFSYISTHLPWTALRRTQHASLKDHMMSFFLGWVSCVYLCGGGQQSVWYLPEVLCQSTINRFKGHPPSPKHPTHPPTYDPFHTWAHFSVGVPGEKAMSSQPWCYVKLRKAQSGEKHYTHTLQATGLFFAVWNLDIQWRDNTEWYIIRNVRSIITRQCVKVAGSNVINQADDTVRTVSLQIYMSNKTSHLITLVSHTSQVSMQPTFEKWWHIPLSYSVYSSPQAGVCSVSRDTEEIKVSVQNALHFLNSQNLEKVICNIVAFISLFFILRVYIFNIFVSSYCEE